MGGKGEGGRREESFNSQPPSFARSLFGRRDIPPLRRRRRRRRRRVAEGGQDYLQGVERGRGGISRYEIGDPPMSKDGALSKDFGKREFRLKNGGGALRSQGEIRLAREAN